MKFKIEKDIILDSLQKILGPTTSKQNFPILSSVFLQTEGEKIKFTTTDLDTTIINTCSAQVIENGNVAIPMRRFLSIIKELPTGEITVELTKNNLLISCGKIEFKINTLNAAEFPKIEESKKASLIKLNPQTLEEMIRLTSFSVGYEDTNYVLNGILFEIFGETITLVSTDGKRLSLIKKNLHHNQPELKTKISFILPIKAINELYKLIKDKEDELFLFVEENRVGFDFKDTQFIARPIEGEFPDYSQYIPKEGKDKLIVNRVAFLLALKRAGILSTPDYQGVKLDLKKETVTISKQTPQLGEVKEVIDAKYTGQPLQIGFNPAYVIDSLKNLSDDEIVFEFYSADKPAVLRKQDYTYLVLPVKI